MISLIGGTEQSIVARDIHDRIFERKIVGLGPRQVILPRCSAVVGATDPYTSLAPSAGQSVIHTRVWVPRAWP